MHTYQATFFKKKEAKMFKSNILTVFHAENVACTSAVRPKDTAAGMRKGKKKTWRLPTLPQECSTIGVRALDFRVRDGNGYFHSAMATKSAFMSRPEGHSDIS